MHEIDLSQTDLNLLVVLDVLLQERNVTRAAKRLHRTQSAMSHALARLRDQLGDPILVRVGGEMRPTPKAERLGSEVSRLLRTIQRVLGQEAAFDPQTTDRVFTLAAPDFVAAVMPALVERMAKETPNAGVELAPPARGMFRDLADGRYDLVVAPKQREEMEGILSEPAGSLHWVVFARKGHPALASWGADAWMKWPHIRVRTSSDSESPVDRAARAQGLTRRPGTFLPHFLLAPPLLAATNLLMTVPREVLAQVAPRFDLVTLESPVKLEPISLAIHWSAQLDRDPAITWFRATVKSAFAELLKLGESLVPMPQTQPARKRRTPSRA